MHCINCESKPMKILDVDENTRCRKGRRCIPDVDI